MSKIDFCTYFPFTPLFFPKYGAPKRNPIFLLILTQATYKSFVLCLTLYKLTPDHLELVPLMIETACFWLLATSGAARGALPEYTRKPLMKGDLVKGVVQGKSNNALNISQ